jgi:hypothetical protein
MTNQDHVSTQQVEKAAAESIPVNPPFKLIFRSVLTLTVLLFVVNVILVLTVQHPSAQAQSLIDLCSRLCTIGFGAIFGLLGGKAT